MLVVQWLERIAAADASDSDMPVTLSWQEGLDFPLIVRQHTLDKLKRERKPAGSPASTALDPDVVSRTNAKPVSTSTRNI